MTVYIIHGCPLDKEREADPATRTYDKHWIPWTRRELESSGLKVETPLMPNPWKPVYVDFKEEFEKFNFSEEDIFVGHSCGSAFLVRWLGDSKKKAKKLIIVAPWKVSDPDDQFREDFCGYEIDESIKGRVGEIIVFTSDDEEEEGKRSAEMFANALEAKIIELPKHGHYTMEDMKTESFPELLSAIEN